MKRGENQLFPAVITALLLGVGLHDLFRIFPSILTEFVAPVNESLWEHGKLIFFPLLLVELVFFTREQRAAGLVSILLACAGMLAVAWWYHVYFGGTELWVDILLFVVSISAYFVLRPVLPVPRRMLPILSGVYLLVIGLIFSFTITPPHGTLFNDPTLTGAWIALPC